MYVCLFTLFIVVNNIVILYCFYLIIKCLYSTCNAYIRKDCLCVSIISYIGACNVWYKFVCVLIFKVFLKQLV